MKNNRLQEDCATQLEKIVYGGLYKAPLFKQGDKVTVGFSGGADSVALLHLLMGFREQGTLTLQAAHLNHQLRGDESHRDEAFCKAFTEKHQIPFFSKKVDVAARSQEAGLSVEEGARKERYRFFNQVAGQGKIATGHTLSDQVETVLLNLTRGSGLDGLGGIPRQRGPIIRPLLQVTRQQVEDYCSHYSLDYVQDSTNAQRVFTRNKLRHEVVPVLKEINPALERQVEQLTRLVEQDKDYLNQQGAAAYAALVTDEGLCRSTFLQLPPSLSSRVLILLLEKEGLIPDYERVKLMHRGIRKKQQVQLSEGVFLRVSGGCFILDRPQSSPTVERQEMRLDFSAGQEIKVPLDKDRTLLLQCIDCKDFGNNPIYTENELKNLLDYDKIGVLITLGPRQPGDRFAPLGRGLHKSLKKLFIEEKIPVWKRDKLLVLEGQEGLLWVEGFGVHDRYKIQEHSTKAVFVHINNEQQGESHEG